MLGAFAVPGAIVWAALGALLGAPPIHGAARWAAVVYGIGAGLLQVTSSRWRPPGSGWQVPSGWVRHGRAWVNTLVWGALLGPGLVTRNPYGSIWMLVLLLASIEDALAAAIVGAAIGLLQGGGRAVGVVRMTWVGPPPYFALVLKELRWRVVDGVWLIAIGTLTALSR